MAAVSFIIFIVLLLIRIIKYFSSDSYKTGYTTSPTLPITPTENKTSVIPGKPFYTNAPTHWGVITDEFLNSNKKFVASVDSDQPDSVETRRQWMVNSLVIMGTINENLTKYYDTKMVSSYGDALLDCNDQHGTTCCVEKLFGKGVISVTGIVIDNFVRYGVILCEDTTPQQYIDQLRQCFVDDGYQDLIYYCQHAPTSVDIEKPLKFQSFNKECFRFDKSKQAIEKLKYGEYAMWWAGETEPNFNEAVIKDDIRISLDMLDFHNSYALGILSYAFGLKKNNSRVKLPDHDRIVINGPEGVQIIITLSNQKGINFHFPTLPRFEQYRNKFIKVYIEFCYSIRSQILEHDLPIDEFETVSTLIWYDELLAEAKNNSTKITSVGVLIRPD